MRQVPKGRRTSPDDAHNLYSLTRENKSGWYANGEKIRRTLNLYAIKNPTLLYFDGFFCRIICEKKRTRHVIQRAAGPKNLGPCGRQPENLPKAPPQLCHPEGRRPEESRLCFSIKYSNEDFPLFDVTATHQTGIPSPRNT